MALYVYCPVGSTGARDLAAAAGAKRVKKPLPWKKGDTVVMWGACLIGIPDDVETLNNVPLLSKLSELKRFKEKGVSTVEFHVGLPPKEKGWLARVKNHQGGKDLLSGRKVGDFYTKKEDLVEEYRVHVWKGQSIRLGKKVPREGLKKEPHPWIRSYDGGWKLSYAGWQPPSGVRQAAKAAIEALGLDFGAVDVGVTGEGKVVVLEVNRRPGLEGNTTKIYAAHLTGKKEVAA